MGRIVKKLVCHCGAVEAEINLNGDLGDFRPACLGLNDSTVNTTTYKFTADL